MPSKNGMFILLWIMTAASLASCDVFLYPPSTPVTPTQTAPPTATMVWFPATNTPTAQAFATNPPTPEMRPGLGAFTLTDEMNEMNWDTASSNEASVSVIDQRLNLAVSSGIYVFSLRHDLVLNDFYAEITARPSLCRGNDTYGFLVRASAVAYYRFALTCDGRVGAERVSVRSRQTLQTPLPSGDVPRGAPGEVKIGVWAVGGEMRLFLNNRFQFTVNDSSYAFGTLGVFVNSAGANPAVVSFSDLVVREVNYVRPQSTPGN